MSRETMRVRAVAGRIARTSPNGDIIPNDRYVTIDKTAYTARLLHHWGDLELEPAPVDEPKPTPPAAPVAASKKE